MAAWWLVTRSMVLHSVLLGVMLILATIIEGGYRLRTPSYTYVLNRLPAWAWGSILIVLALAWLYTRGWRCVMVGVSITLWYFTFAVAFLVAFLTLPQPGTTVTAWVTYFFLGWWWGVVTYVIWRDEKHIKAETAKLVEVREQIQKLNQE